MYISHKIRLTLRNNNGSISLKGNETNTNVSTVHSETAVVTGFMMEKFRMEKEKILL